MHGRIRIYLVASLALAAVAHADAPDGMAKYRSFTPDQIMALPEKERESDVPMAYLGAAGLGAHRHGQTFLAVHLNTLMYPAVSDFEGAVKAFQADLGEPVTGVLTVGQIHEMESRAKRMTAGEVYLPTQLSGYRKDDYAEAEGTMTLEPSGEVIAWPVNHVKVSCYRERDYCRLDQIMLEPPREHSWTNSYHVMQSSPEFYTITRWGEETIEASQEAGEDQCRNVTLTLNFKTKEFFQITTNGSKPCSVLGTSVPRLTRPRVAQLVDGMKVQIDFYAQRRKERGPIVSQAYRRKMEAAIADVEAEEAAKKAAPKK